MEGLDPVFLRVLLDRQTTSDIEIPWFLRYTRFSRYLDDFRWIFNETTCEQRIRSTISGFIWAVNSWLAAVYKKAWKNDPVV